MQTRSKKGDAARLPVLKQNHDDPDRAVSEAYGWPADLSDEEILKRLVALNAERAAEESRGLIRWLRPDFQNPQCAPTVTQSNLDLTETPETPTPATPKTKKTPWPKTLPDQARALRELLAAATTPLTPESVAASFSRPNVDRIEELLDTLASLGQAREVEEGKFVA